MNARGGSKVNLFLGLLVTAALVVGVLRVIPVYIRSYEFKDEIRNQCKFAAMERKSIEVVRETLLKKAKELELPVRREDIRITESGTGIRITAQYSVPVNLFVYETRLSFSVDEDTRSAY